MTDQAVKTSTVQSKGIFHGLPTFPSSLNGQSAVVFGANGISGYHMLRVLSESPERWTDVTAFSRRPQMNARGVGTNVRQEELDLMQSPEEIAEVFVKKGIKAYVMRRRQDCGRSYSKVTDQHQRLCLLFCVYSATAKGGLDFVVRCRGNVPSQRSDSPLLSYHRLPC